MKNEIRKLKEKLKDQIIFLGHHYQSDEILEFADYVGDSLELSRRAAQEKKPFIIFCGVNFMAETADILTSETQKVILPHLGAGCSMADMANLSQVEKAWIDIKKMTKEKIIPITYINCSAELKSFVGKHEGSICTSSNAKKIVNWALNEGEKVFFFPDQHLGRNTSYDLGIPLDKMLVYHPDLSSGGLTSTEIENAKVILWYGYCDVHQRFSLSDLKKIRQDHPQTKILVHPECPFEIVQMSDYKGATSQIVDLVKKAPQKSSFAIATEINLTKRLQKENPHKEIILINPEKTACETMAKIDLKSLYDVLKSIDEGRTKNIISVPKPLRENALKALNKMLSLS